MVVGEANISTAGGTDLAMANNIAREMVYRCGFSKRLGPIALMDTEEVYLNRERSRSIANISTPLARIATEEVQAVRYLMLLRLLPSSACTCTMLPSFCDMVRAGKRTMLAWYNMRFSEWCCFAAT
jgi:hypothetical protein